MQVWNCSLVITYCTLQYLKHNAYYKLVIISIFYQNNNKNESCQIKKSLVQTPRRKIVMVV